MHRGDRARAHGAALRALSLHAVRAEDHAPARGQVRVSPLPRGERGAGDGERAPLGGRLVGGLAGRRQLGHQGDRAGRERAGAAPRREVPSLLAVGGPALAGRARALGQWRAVLPAAGPADDGRGAARLPPHARRARAAAAAALGRQRHQPCRGTACDARRAAAGGGRRGAGHRPHPPHVAGAGDDSTPLRRPRHHRGVHRRAAARIAVRRRRGRGGCAVGRVAQGSRLTKQACAQGR
mmetsp:Transcript_14618/g.33394  ORF Transcript_14618/g.33394 Transcript_14618/m.33394 type:complete len:238 (-) Transcript_14618:129-842(-)